MENQASKTSNRTARAWLPVWAIAAGCWGLGVGGAAAEIVHLIGGERVIGRMISQDPARIVMESQALGRLEIPRERIAGVESEPVVEEREAAPRASLPPFAPPPPTSTAGGAGPAGGTGRASPGSPFGWLVGEGLFDDPPGTDWIQLKSGEWLRGKMQGMHNRKLEFDSDELDDLSFEWKDVHRAVLPNALVSYGTRRSAWGTVEVDREKVKVTGEDDLEFPRNEVVGIAPGTPHELDYWSGKFNVGLNLQAGNTRQADLLTRLRVERRTPGNHLKVEYSGNFSESDGQELVNNQRVTEFFDVFLTRRMFVRVPQSEYYHDPFQNIDYRFTAGGGVGYYVVDQPKAEWFVAGGPAYRFVEFENVPAGDAINRSAPAFFLQTELDVDLTRRVDLEMSYQMVAGGGGAGGLTTRAGLTLEIDLTRRLDVDISFTWDRVGNPQPDASGEIPDQDDYRLNLSFGLNF